MLERFAPLPTKLSAYTFANLIVFVPISELLSVLGIMFSPMIILLPIPTPPSMTTAPVVTLVEFV